MRIFYYLSHYISHRLAGLAYIELLRGIGHTVLSNLPPDFSAGSPLAAVSPPDGLSSAQYAFLEGADLVILHQEPTCYNAIYEALPVLTGKRVIAYAVWENEKLAPYFIAPLNRVSAVWTCSEFCRTAIAPHVEQCCVLPHLVRRTAPLAGDLQWAENILSASRKADAFVFLSVIDAVNPRKNLRGLLAAFSLLRGITGRPVRLLLKQYRVKMPLNHLPDIINVTADVSPNRMAALYALCDAYVSAHHAEGWGLGMSEAMSYGKPVIATGYSGNMDYMTGENSFPIPYAMRPVSDEQCAKFPLFGPDMLWAEADMSKLVAAMRRVAEGRYDHILHARAAEIVKRFGLSGVGARLAQLLSS
ncbi:MAG: glycosyltransferase [Desulfovibrio sp.]|jgi:glycosyltransferase involved in cell wall biosynthesis|nr:glycosyltransferase [Desulfovibrio sp.]